MSNLTVPSSVFYGRKKRLADAANAKCVSPFSSAVGVVLKKCSGKSDLPDFPPPPPFIPLNASTIQHHLPTLLHSFFMGRQESGAGLDDDEGFDTAHSQIGSLGQIINKAIHPVVPKKKKEVVKNPDRVNGEAPKKKKKKPACVASLFFWCIGSFVRFLLVMDAADESSGTGVGRGNWSKYTFICRWEGNADRIVRPSKEEKARRAADLNAALAQSLGNGAASPVSGDGEGEEEDAEGEEE